MLPAGTHSITATYSGDSNYQSTNAAAISQQVTAATVDGILENYYLTILGRPSDSTGKSYYLSEVARLYNLQVDRRESLRVIAKFFYNGTEYAQRNRTDSQ